jgi:threonine dehydratase
MVPVGGGGLISGISAALADAAHWSVIGVEAESAASMTASLEAGRPTTLPHMATMADGIALKSPCELTLGHVQAQADRVITVCEEDIATALLLILERARTVVEPAGAVGLAGLLAGAVPGDGPVVCVLSGGNVDPMLLAALIEHGLTAAGRFLRLRVIAPDRPGALARLTAHLAELGLNVTAVEHHREGATVGLAEVEILITVETRDRAHGDEVLQSLDAAGIRAEVLN